MRLAAVTMVRSECDIIEAFVRHNAAFFDRLYILDHRSTDTTPGHPPQIGGRRIAVDVEPRKLRHLLSRSEYDGP
jgi:hypothetical protein